MNFPPPGPGPYGPYGHFQPPPQYPPQYYQPPPQPQMPYIGARISLISNLDIRYEGTLYTIDPVQATVALQNVHCFGTEDRPVANFVPPAPTIYEFIIFRGKDIKDLHVSERPAAPGPAAPYPQDPAIIGTTRPPAPESSEDGAKAADKDETQSGQAADGTTVTAQEPSSSQQPSSASSQQQQPQPQPQQQQQQQQQARGPGSRGGRGGRRHAGARGEQQQQPQSQQQGSEDGYSGPGSGNFLHRSRMQHRKQDQKMPNEEFDFESSNARFNKEDFLKQLQTVKEVKEKEKEKGSDDSESKQNEDASSATPATATSTTATDEAGGEADKEKEKDEGDKAAANEDPIDEETAKLLAQLNVGTDLSQIGPKYNKSQSFFDDISTDRDRPGRDAANTRAQRQRDVDTFGDSAAHYRSRHGRGGYRGHGGHGGHGGAHHSGGGQRRGGGGYRRGGRDNQQWRQTNNS